MRLRPSRRSDPRRGESTRRRERDTLADALQRDAAPARDDVEGRERGRWYPPERTRRAGVGLSGDREQQGTHHEDHRLLDATLADADGITIAGRRLDSGGPRARRRRPRRERVLRPGGVRAGRCCWSKRRGRSRARSTSPSQHRHRSHSGSQNERRRTTSARHPRRNDAELIQHPSSHLDVMPRATTLGSFNTSFC